MAVPFFGNAQQRNTQDSLVEVSGVTLTADSSLVIPDVSILIQGKNRGTMSNDEGVFSIVAIKGDVLVFSAIGFKTKQITIPADLPGNHYGMAQLMVQDTTYLPVTVIRPYPSKDEFEDAFLHWNIPDNKYDIARNNTSLDKLKALEYYTPPDGGEGVNQTFNQQFRAAQYKGGFPPMNIFNPLAWAKFIKALKDGDFKRKD
ncbi:MAG TPA: carboxypeptidase-like regulatory domain-containing protein [Chitinophagaceae bacterium]|nr:carboxypeptidase-like regulatory domain-containing protein [Chitinophagaceae bacterium]